MRKDGRGYGDHDDDPGPTWIGYAAFFGLFVAVAAYGLAVRFGVI